MIILSSYPLDEENNRRIAEAAAAVGGTFIPAPEERERIIEQVEERIAEADVLLGGRLTAEQFARAARLRWIHVPWAGVNSLLQVESIARGGITITNSSGVMSDAVADQTLGLMLALVRDLPRQILAQRERRWEKYPTESPRRGILRGRALGIIGHGAIGAAVARRAAAFGMRIIVLRRNASAETPGADLVLDPTGLERLLEESDILVLAAPLTDGTRGMIGAGELRRMKPGAYLVNISRGALVREGELIEALRDGAIAGAALDVFETEPLPESSPLWEMPNVIVTPHSAGGFRGFGRAVTDLFLENLRRFSAGEPLENLVRPEAGY